MGGQFHELQYYLKVIRNGGKVLGWKYYGNHPEHVNCPPWEIHVDLEDVADYCASKPRTMEIDGKHKVIHIGCQDSCGIDKKNCLIL